MLSAETEYRSPDAAARVAAWYARSLRLERDGGEEACHTLTALREAFVLRLALTVTVCGAAGGTHVVEHWSARGWGQ
jgi:hypothetical protein